MKLLLFDLDGTLFEFVPKDESLPLIHRLAVQKVTGVFPSLMFEREGMLAGHILLKLLQDNNLDTARLGECRDALSQVFEETLYSYDIRLLPGVQTFLEIMEKKGVHLGLATGNDRKTSYAKLRAAGIDSFFKFGGFDCEGVKNRSEIIHRAIKEAESMFGFRAMPDKVFYIGDTHHDVLSGKEAGVFTIAVLTSRVKQDRGLLRKSADCIVENLEIGRKELCQCMGIEI